VFTDSIVGAVQERCPETIISVSKKKEKRNRSDRPFNGNDPTIGSRKVESIHCSVLKQEELLLDLHLVQRQHDELFVNPAMQILMLKLLLMFC